MSRRYKLCIQLGVYSQAAAKPDGFSLPHPDVLNCTLPQTAISGLFRNPPIPLTGDRAITPSPFLGTKTQNKLKFTLTLRNCNCKCQALTIARFTNSLYTTNMDARN